MYLYLSLVGRKVAELYHNTDRRRYLFWLKWLILITSSGQMVSLMEFKQDSNLSLSCQRWSDRVKSSLPVRCPLFVQSFRPDQTEKIGMRDVKGGLRGVPGDQGGSGGSRGVQGILGDRGGRQWPPPLLQSCKAFNRGDSIPVWTKQQRFRPSQDPSSRGSARVQDKSTYHIIFCNKQLIFVKKHRKNCECCPGHHLIVDHYSSI